MKNDLFENKLDLLGKSVCSKVDYQFKEKNVKISIRKTKYLLIAAIIIVLSLGTVAGATNIWSLFSENLGGMGLVISEKNSLVNYPLSKVEDKGIIMKVNGAVAGSEHIVLNLQFSGLKEINLEETLIEPKNLQLVSQDGEFVGNSSAEVERVFTFFPRTQNDDGSYSEIVEIRGNLEKTQKVKLLVTNIAGVDGNWGVEFDINYVGEETYILNEEFDIYEGKIKVDQITIDALGTTIEFQYIGVNERQYYVVVESDKENSVMTKFEGVIGDIEKKEILSSGKMGIKYYMRSVPSDAKLTVRVTPLDFEKMDDVESFVIDLNRVIQK